MKITLPYPRFVLALVVLQFSVPSCSDDEVNCDEAYTALEIALCTNQSSEKASDSAQHSLESITKKIEKLPKQYHYLKDMVTKEKSTWEKRTEATCFLKAELAYPLDAEDAGRANDLEKKYGYQ